MSDLVNSEVSNAPSRHESNAGDGVTLTGANHQGEAPMETGIRILQSVIAYIRRRRSVSAAVGIDYLVCRDLDILRDIAAGDLSQIPGNPSRVVPTNQLSRWKRLADRYEYADRSSEFWSREFDGLASYLIEHPNAVPVRRSRSLPGFEAWRVVPRDEFLSTLAAEDEIARSLFDGGAPVRNLVIAGLFRGGCEEVSFNEHYLLSPVWGVLLRIRNNSSAPVRIDDLLVSERGQHGDEPSRFEESEPITQERSYPFPPVQLAPGESIMMPVATVLPWLPDGLQPFREGDWVDVGEGRGQRSGVQSAPTRVKDWLAIGSWDRPESLIVSMDGGRTKKLPLRFLGGSLPFVVSRSWLGGSCPHLFERIGSDLVYVGEVFDTDPGGIVTFTYVASQEADALLLVELEEEVTYLVKAVTGSLIIRPRVLRRTDWIEIPLGHERSCVFTGWYESEWDGSKSVLETTAIVSGFIESFRLQESDVSGAA